MRTIKLYTPLLLTAILLNIPNLNAQRINIDTENENIGQFIKIWGLVKYKSQKSIRGDFDADKVFLNLIDSVKNADKGRFNQLMLAMIGQAQPPLLVQTHGEFRGKLDPHKYLLKNIDYRWLTHKRFSDELKKQLKALSERSNSSGKHQYVPSVWYENNLPNEKPYADYTFSEERMNLLTLAKVWNAIEYLFPYKYMTDKNWDKVLREMVPFFRDIKNRVGYEKGLLRLAVAINDTHGAELLENLKMVSTIFNVRYYPPFDYNVVPKGIIITKFLNDSLAQNTELKPGDIITSINGISVERWNKERAAWLPASNDAVKYRELGTSNNNRGDTFAFSNLESGILNVKVKRDQSNLQLKLVMLDRSDRQNVKLIENDIIQKRLNERNIKGLENIGLDITLIRAGNFFDKDLPKDDELLRLSAELKSKKALIFDMRKYPQAPGLFSYYLPLMLGKAPFAFARYYAADMENLGAFIHREAIEDYMYVPKDGPKPTGELYTGKIVILTNENTQSMGEWFTMMLRQLNGKTTVIGSQTAGADGDVRRLTLPGNYHFSFTGNGIFYPNGRETQRVGIKPDIYFKASAKDLSGADDAHLQRALKYIREGK